MRIILFVSASAAALMMAATAAAQTAASSTALQTGQAASPSTTATPATPPQNAQDRSQAQVTPGSGSGLGDIVVTAQRTRENLQRAAVPVDVVQGAQLTASGTTSVGNLDRLVPALTVQPSSTGNLIFIRGVGNFTLVPTSDPAIAFNYDGVYVGRPTSTANAFFDLERVEVLKGPQGTLYGRNATGGAINVIPTRPKPDEFSGYATASYGNYDAFIGEGAINVPLGTDGAVRLSGSVTSRDGYLEDGTSNDKNWALRGQILLKPTPDLTVRLAADYTEQDGVGVGASYLGRYQYAGPVAANLFIPANLPLSDGFYTTPAQTFRQTSTAGPAGRRVDALSPYPFRRNNFAGANAEITWQTDVGTLTVIPAYRNSKLNYLADAAAFIARTHEEDDQYSLEVRFAGKRIGIFDYTLGGYYFKESIDALQGIYVSAIASVFRDKLHTESFAPFGRLTAHLSDALRLVGGIRYTHDRKTFAELGTTGTIACQVVTLAGPSCPAAPLFPFFNNFTDLTFPFPAAGQIPPVVPAGGGAIAIRSERAQANRLGNQRVTWRAAAEYDLGPRSLLYASVETGFRSGGFSSAAGFETYDPEYITAYTIGSKNRLFDNRLQLNVEGFYWRYRDQQVNFVGPDINGVTANQTRNIGRSTIKGVDVETQFLLTPTTLLNAQVQYLDTENKDFVYQTLGTPTPPIVGCPVAAASATLVNVDCSGFPAYNAPKWTVNLAAQQTIELGAVKLVLGADTQYKTKRYIAFQYLPQELQPGVWQSNAQITLASSADRWSISGFVQNIEQHRTPTFESLTPITNFLVVTTTAPRTYGVRGSFRF